MSSSPVISEIRGSTLLLTISRPEVMNASNSQVLEKLNAALDAAEKVPAVRGIIITGAGEKAFVAGADISVIHDAKSRFDAMKISTEGQQLFEKIEGGSKPVLAAINGFALGGGCELAMACQLRIASVNAKFGQPEVNLGLIPGYGGTQRLPRLIGRTKATELILTGDMITAEQALVMGLVNAVTSSTELITKCEEILNKIYSKSARAVALALRAIDIGVNHPDKGMQREAELFTDAVLSADGKEGTKAFLEKRKPLFTGK